MESIDIDKISENLAKTEQQIRDYVYIMQNRENIDKNFKRIYKRLYRVRRNSNFCDQYFEYLKQNISKKDTLTFEDTIEKIYEISNRVEASFSSKLLATINPKKPIWDTKILYRLKDEIGKEYILIYKNEKNKRIYYKFKVDNKSDKIESAIEVYKKLTKKMEQKLLNEDAKEYIKIFNQTYEKMFKDDKNILDYKDEITDMKKLDFVLWSPKN